MAESKFGMSEFGLGLGAGWAGIEGMRLDVGVQFSRMSVSWEPNGVSDYVDAAKERRTDLAEVEKRVNAVKGRWLGARDKLMAQSGGGVGSPWAEDSALWSETW
ncbi:MAG: hypothetical protein HYZ27_05875 [Deltaproteobacteria bacterium]|nr:hypothetical protein [Deltaproteobacteria bacterium]